MTGIKAWALKFPTENQIRSCLSESGVEANSPRLSLGNPILNFLSNEQLPPPTEMNKGKAAAAAAASPPTAATVSGGGGHICQSPMTFSAGAGRERVGHSGPN